METDRKSSGLLDRAFAETAAALGLGSGTAGTVVLQLRITELEPAEYSMKLTIKSQLRRLPPFINLLFFFVKETEFEVTESSEYFTLKRSAK